MPVSPMLLWRTWALQSHCARGSGSLQKVSLLFEQLEWWWGGQPGSEEAKQAENNPSVLMSTCPKQLAVAACRMSRGLDLSPARRRAAPERQRAD